MGKTRKFHENPQSLYTPEFGPDGKNSERLAEHCFPWMFKGKKFKKGMKNFSVTTGANGRIILDIKE